MQNTTFLANIVFTPKIIKRFHSKVAKKTAQECWTWEGKLGVKGYGIFRVGKKLLRPNRVAYFLATGIDPKDKCVCHTCDSPSCCNSDHHFLGTQAENQEDKVKKGRQAKGATSGPRNHPERMARGDANGQRLHPEKTARGEKNGFAKLTDTQVLEIRAKHATLGRTGSALAKEYGMTKTSISRILRRKSWKHI